MSAALTFPALVLFSAIIGSVGLTQRVQRDVAAGDLTPAQGRYYVVFYRAIAGGLATASLILVGLTLLGK